MKNKILSICAPISILLLFGTSCKHKEYVMCNISKLSGDHHWTSNDGHGSRSDDFPIEVINDSTIHVSGYPGSLSYFPTLQLISVSNGISVFHTHTFYDPGNNSGGIPNIDSDVTLTYYCSLHKIVYVVVETYSRYGSGSSTFELDAATN